MLAKTFNILSILARMSLGLALLISLSLATGILARPAHAQTILTVTDCSNDSQLQADVTQANSDNAGDTITFGCSGSIGLTSTLNINGNMTIDGSGQTVSIGIGNGSRDLSVASGVTLTINALTISGSISYPASGGLLNYGGTVTISNSTFYENGAPKSGGGILNLGGTLTITNSTFSTNSASYGQGGGLENGGGTVSITNSLFVSNFADLGSTENGAGIYNSDGTLTIIGSTFSNNHAGSNGGAIYNIGQSNSGIVNITNSSFVENSAFSEGGGLYTQSGSVSISSSSFAGNTANSSGGGLYISGKVNIGESILSDAGSDCAGEAAPIDLGYNLESGTSCGFTGTGDLQNTNPMFEYGQNNNTILQQGSPAIDKVPLADCPSTDQYGNPRPDDPSESSCDMGSDESSYPPAAVSDLGLSNMPGNITTNATSSQGATVTYTSPTATDESGDNPAPTVNCTPASGSVFPIGTTTVNCSATDSDDTPGTASGSFSVTVQPALSVTGTTVSATEGSVFNGVIATGNVYGLTGSLTASITWGDGNTSTLNVTPASDGSYSVSASHTYAEEGQNTISITVSDSNGHSSSTTDTATVSDAALTLKLFAVSSVKHLTAGLAGLFTDADPAGTVSDYQATVNWGDGTTSTVTVAKIHLGSRFVLAAAHNYAKAGTYTVTLTVTDQGGSKLTKTASVTVK
jgi:hypothetical protein